MCGAMSAAVLLAVLCAPVALAVPGWYLLRTGAGS